MATESPCAVHPTLPVEILPPGAVWRRSLQSFGGRPVQETPPLEPACTYRPLTGLSPQQHPPARVAEQDNTVTLKPTPVRPQGSATLRAPRTSRPNGEPGPRMATLLPQTEKWATHKGGTEPLLLRKPGPNETSFLTALKQKPLLSFPNVDPQPNLPSSKLLPMANMSTLPPLGPNWMRFWPALNYKQLRLLLRIPQVTLLGTFLRTENWAN